MASPQLENGHTRIAHEIIYAICKSSLSPLSYRIILWVLRLTYGFHRKNVITSTGAFAKVLNKNKDEIRRTMLELEQLRVLQIEWGSPDLCTLSFNKNHEEWKCLA